MEFASFYGLTAPQLILLDLDKGTFNTLVKMLNNAQDSKRLADLLVEFNLLERFLSEGIIMEYENGDLRKKERQVRLSKEHYETGKPIPPNMLLEKEDIAMVEQMIASAPKRVAPYVMINGNRKDISAEAVKIIEYMRRSIGLVKPYIQSIKINSVKEITVFNRRLEDIVYGKPNALRYRYMNKLNQVKSSSRRANVILPVILESLRKDVDILLSSINDSDVEREDESPNSVTVAQSGSKYIVGNIPNSYPKESRKLIEYVASIGIIKKFNERQLQTLSALFLAIQSLDVEVYNSSFGLDLNEEGYKRVFNELDKLGLIGLNLYTEKFLFNSLNGIALTRDLKAIIADEEMKTVVYEIDRALTGINIKYGEAI